MSSCSVSHPHLLCFAFCCIINLQNVCHNSSTNIIVINYTYFFISSVNRFTYITYFTLHWQLFPPPPQLCAGVQTSRGRALLPPAVRQLWGTKMPKAGCPLQWHPVWWDAAWIQQQNPASQLGTDIPNDLPVTSVHTFTLAQMHIHRQN